MQPSMALADDANPDSRLTGSAEHRAGRDRQRGSIFARAAKFLCEKRVTIRVAVISVAGTLVVVAVSVVGWWLYGRWRTGRVELLTEGDPVVVQVLAEDSDTPIGEPFDLATRAVVELPEGDYRLRVNGKGRIGRTFRFAVNRGETLAHSVSIDEGWLLGEERAAEDPDHEPNDSCTVLVDREGVQEPQRRSGPVPVANVTAALELTAGKADLIEWTGESLIRRDGATGRVIWDALHPAKPFENDRDPASWLSRYFDSRASRGDFLESAPDLNGDGTGDVIFLSGKAAAIVALSGRDGSMLWIFRASDDGSDGPAGDELAELRRVLRSMVGSTAGEPAVIDVDGDGTLDLIATVRFSDAFQNRPGKWIVLGISGRSGRRLWSYADREGCGRHDWPSREDRRAVLVRGPRSTLLALVDGSEWVGLDATIGKLVAGPIDLGGNPVVPVQHADLDGDGTTRRVPACFGPGPTDSGR